MNKKDVQVAAINFLQSKIDGLKIQPNCHLREGSRTIVIKKK